MILFFGILLFLTTLPGTVELFGLTLAALFPPLRKPAHNLAVPLRLAILIPAYNEESGISHTLNSLKACEGTADIWVIADNCTDQTASTARALGMEVLERSDPSHRGKDYALKYALEKLLLKEYEAYAIVDADTQVAPNFIERIQHAFEQGAEALQVRYIQKGSRIVKAGFIAMNVLRPLGRQHLGLSVGCLGNGFAIRHTTLQAVPWNVHAIVEDVAYHLELVRAGFRVQFLEETTVLAEAPPDISAFLTQRQRWEGGRFRLLREKAPQLIKEILQGKLRLLEPLLDLLTLPLSYHSLLLFTLLLLPIPLLQGYALFALAVLLFHLLSALWRCGGEWQDLFALLLAPFYLIWRVLHLGTLVQALKQPLKWTRTKRPGE